MMRKIVNNVTYLRLYVCRLFLLLFLVGIGNMYARADVVAIQQDSIVTVSGKVTDSLGIALEGVSVSVQGQPRTGINTGQNGLYVLKVSPNATLVFSFVGYDTQNVPVQGRTEINLTLSSDQSALDEVVVVGFGTQKKLTSVGAQSTVNPKELKTPVRNLTTVLAGRMSGIIAVQRSGEPGMDDANIWIRGIATQAGSSTPLVLVDGVERGLSDVPPEDIESFSILKDASATAVYGVRGANGVILVNTRKGIVQKVKVNTFYTEGISQFTRRPELADGITYMQMANEALSTRDRSKMYSDEAIQMAIDGSDRDLYANTDWFKEIFNDWGNTRQFNVNMQGGSERANFYASGSYITEVGQLKRDEVQKYDSRIGSTRYNFTSNLAMKATNTTKVDLGISGFIIDGNYPGVDTDVLFRQALEVPSVLYPAVYSDGSIPSIRNGEPRPFNPYASLTQSGYRSVSRTRVNSNIKATQDFSMITKGLSAYAMFAFDSYFQTMAFREKTPDTWLATGRDADGNLISEQTKVGTTYLGFSRPGTASNRRFYSENAINYTNAFGKHEVTGMALFNWSDYVNNMAGDFISSLPYRYLGFAGRTTYAYDSRYLLELNAGYNGGENFAPSRQFGFFPSIGLGWVFSEEAFFENLKEVIPMGKIRFSRGAVGNADIGGRRFGYIALVGGGNGGYTYGRDFSNHYPSGIDISEYAIDVSWERAVKTNLGIDMNLMRGDLNVQFDLFHERRDGSFLRRSALPAYLGLINNPYGNLGVTENKGLDGSLSYNGRISQDFRLNLQFNFTFNRNRIIEDDRPSWNYPWRERKGQKIGQGYGLIASGLFTSQDEVNNSALQIGDTRAGDIRYVDLNNDGVIDDNDSAPIGYGSIPELVYGMRVGFAYKNFSMNAFFQGISNVDIYTNGEGFVPFQQGFSRGNLLSIVEDRWTEENPNPNAFFPRLNVANDNMNYRTSTWWLQNGAFLRLKTLDLNYTLNRSFTDRYKVGSASIFFQGFNLLTFSDFKLWDVELGDGRGTAYPMSRIYSLGVQLSF